MIVPAMSRKHFAFIAATIKEMAENTTYADCAPVVARHFARRLRATNATFKESKFLEACGVQE